MHFKAADEDETSAAQLFASKTIGQDAIHNLILTIAPGVQAREHANINKNHGFV